MVGRCLPMTGRLQAAGRKRDAELMTTTPPAAAPVPRTSRVIHLSELLKRPVTDRGGESLGRVPDVIVRLRGAQLPAVGGLAAPGGGLAAVVPVDRASLFYAWGR